MNTILTVFLITAVLVAVALLGMAVTILIKKNGRFPQIHIGKNKEMRDRGIHCASTTDFLERKNYRPVDIK